MLCDQCGDCYGPLTDVRVLNMLANLLGVDTWSGFGKLAPLGPDLHVMTMPGPSPTSSYRRKTRTPLIARRGAMV